MTDYPTEQQERVSLSFMTVACVTMLVMNFVIFPTKAMWKRIFPIFDDVPEPLRRHDINLILRSIIGLILGPVVMYIAVKTYQDVQWFIDNRKFISYVTLVYLLLDLFELTQRRKFDLQAYTHHTLQTLYTIYFLEWGPADAYNYAFPNLGLLIFSTFGRPVLFLFPLERVASRSTVRLVAKMCLMLLVFAITTGLTIMLVLVVSYKDRLPLVVTMIYPIVYVVFNAIDLPLYKMIYAKAFSDKNVLVSKERDSKDGRHLRYLMTSRKVSKGEAEVPLLCEEQLSQ